MPTDRLLLSVTPGNKLVYPPALVVTPPVGDPIKALRPSEKPSFAALFVTDRSCEGAGSPTWKLPKSTGSGVWAEAIARRKTDPVTFTVCEASGVSPRPLEPIPSEASEIDAVPDLFPAAAVPMPIARLLLFFAPGANNEKLPLFVVTPPVAEPIEAFSLSEKPPLRALFVSVRN